MSSNCASAPLAVTDTVKTMPTATTHIGRMKLKNDGDPKSWPIPNRIAPETSNAIPRATHPAIPHLATKDFAKRVVVTMTSATVAKAKLNPISE